MYYTILNKILVPGYESLRGRKILKHKDFLKEIQWSRARLLDFQWQELQKLLIYAETQSPYWRRIFQESEVDVRNVANHDDFRKLPFLTKADIKANSREMICGSQRDKKWTSSTGGSTGVPLQFEYTPESYEWRVAETKRAYGWAGCEDGIKQAWIWGVPIGEISGWNKVKENVRHALMRETIFNCFDFTEEKMADCLRHLNKSETKIIAGYTNPLYNFAKFVKAHGGIQLRLTGIISAAETLHDYQRKLIEEVFEAPAFNTYGSREFMLIASECDKHQGLHISMENLLVEVVKEDGTPAKEGEMGEIVITDLHNYGMPFIRYKIGDMAIATQHRCDCGRGLDLLKGVVGRSLDLIETPDGRYVPGEFFPHLMKEFRGIRRFQVIQETREELRIKLVKDSQFTATDFDFMRKEVGKVLGEFVKVDFDFVDEIALTRTGKYRVTVSNIRNKKMNSSSPTEN